MGVSRVTNPPRSLPMFAPTAYVIRLAGDADEAALERLAQLDSAEPLEHPILVGEIDGGVVAALDLDTEREAEGAAASYGRGARENRTGDLLRLRDGGEVLVRPVRAEDKPLFARG